MNADEKNMNLVRTAYAAMESGDLEACVELLTEDFTAHLPGAPHPVHGREVWRAGAQAMRDGFPDLRITVEDMFGAGDKVAVRVRFDGTHRGNFQGLEATGRPVGFRSVEIYRIEGERLAEEWVAPDMLSLMGQIAPEPVAR